MGKLFIVAGLFLAVAGCGASVSSGPSHRLFAQPARVAVPQSIDEKNYLEYRDIYDALSLNTKGRIAFRERLLRYLLHETRLYLNQGQESEAIENFKNALTLFSGEEVYRGALQQKQLDKLAERFINIFSPRGHEEIVFLCLNVRISLHPQNKALKESFYELSRWLKDADQLVQGQSRKWNRLIGVLEEIVQVWPSSFLVQVLERLYLEQKITIARSLHISPYQHLRGAVSALFRSGYKVARLYLQVNDPRQALQHLKKISREPNEDEELRDYLERMVAPETKALDAIRLSKFFQRNGDPAVALSICQMALSHYPPSADLYLCIGRLAHSLKKIHLAMISLERAVELKPDEKSYAEMLAQIYQQRLFMVIAADRLDQARQELSRIELFYAHTKKHFKTPLETSLSGIYYAIGHGYYNAGIVEQAMAAFKKAIATNSDSPEAFFQLATIQFKQNQSAQALSYLKQAEQVPMDSPGVRAYWQGQIEELRGQILLQAGQTKAGQAAHSRALEAWREFRSMEITSEARAESFIHEARSLYGLGKRGKAMDALDFAIDAQPDRKETYADVIAWLTTHGHLPEALDAFHRALGRKEVSEYLKSYCSFWIIGLARRAGLPPDPLALQHLSSIRSDNWYTHLAQLTLKKTTFEELRKKAKTPSNLAELYYYWADHLLVEGQLDQAREMWKKVIETKMMAFYEFDMASYNLRNGPAEVTQRPLDRQTPMERQSQISP
jgi:tetratricopeptide (TPR) repeat protein